MESGSEGDHEHDHDHDHDHVKNSKINSSNEGNSKPKRQMKTPFQLETLEKAYAMEMYPSELTRADLSKKLGLSDRQLQMWFCHRRLKDKKDVTGKKPTKSVVVTPPSPESPVDELRVGGEPSSDYGSGSGSASSPSSYRDMGKAFVRSVGDDAPIGRRYYESSPQTVYELKAIACVEAQLGETLRDDGPILGLEFDPLPPDAFGASIAMTEQQKLSGHPAEGKAAARALHEYQMRQDLSSVRSDAYGQIAQPHTHDFLIDGRSARNSSSVRGNGQLSRAHDAEGRIPRVRTLSQREKQGDIFSSSPRDIDCDVRISAKFVDHPIIGAEDSYPLSDGQVFENNDVLGMERQRKSEEARISREAEAHENRIRKELEKQDILRRKSEERIRKEMEKHDRERRKEEERLIREKQREEERSQREQKREIERRERFLQREYERAEKRRQKEELRREREAVRRKAANEKATARKIAKESMDLIEDEQLELMELAAASKGLPSIINLDHDTLQNLELFRGSLIDFPPNSVLLKRPFAIQPWTDSEENIGNLLMVWRFLITYADVLGLWPFTLDEFVQAFHDYDSRLLGEIHVALLKSIIADIEDVGRTSSTGLGINQNGAADPEGGHPHIVEGAHAWGFDIRKWQKHLNPLTWPEILRQLALSAGFGPQLKKKGISWAYLRDKNEGKGCEDVVSTIRNGSAAENAFAIMQEKGLLAPRRSRHRLTPGTVKFAAYHVLSLEGSKGLTVLELADKIQKSRLRDLRTSKTPEASISVALTRDTKLFERIAPSTYCVRAAFRKDPIDAEAILSDARKKIQIFENGFLPGEDADVIERDEDSECEIDEDPEVDDIAMLSSASNVAEHFDEANACSESGKGKFCNDVAINLQDEHGKGFSPVPLDGSKDINGPSTAIEQYIAGEDTAPSNLEQEIVEIDESESGESWIQGLTEGEYSELSVEERLNALVALIGIANEGNFIRFVLEGRLEAANALKKQMWAEAQLDKVRLKDENGAKLDFTSFAGSKADPTLMAAAVEGSQSPMPIVDTVNNEVSPVTTEEQKLLLGSESVPNHFNSMLTDRNSVVQDFSKGLDNFIVQHNGCTSKRSRSILKSYIAQRAEEMYVYRSLPLGQDRRHNRYWQFVAAPSRNDPGCGRIFVESHDGNWRLIDSEEAFNALFMSLDIRGIRESHLRIMLQNIETSFKETVRRNSRCNLSHRTTSGNVASKMDFSQDLPGAFGSPSSTICAVDSDTLETISSFRIELGRNEIEKKAALERYQDFQRWMWKECFNSLTLRAMKYGRTRCTQLGFCNFCLDSYFTEDAHCFSCHQTFGNGSNFSEHVIQCEEKKLYLRDHRIVDSSVPLGIRLLKAMLVEVSNIPEALQSSWIEDWQKTWVLKLTASSSTEELLQFLTLFESAIKRECLSSKFETTKELLGSSNLSRSVANDFADLGSVPVLPWIPKTTAAVALRLLELDASIFYVQNEKAEYEENKFRDCMKLPSRYAPLKNNKELELVELSQDQHMKGKDRTAMFNGRNGYKRGRGGREQGRAKRNMSRVRGSKSVANRQNVVYNDILDQGLGLQGRRTNTSGGGRGRRTVRRRPDKRPLEETSPVHAAETVSPKSSGDSAMDIGEEEWSNKRIRMMDREGANNSNIAGTLESDDEAEGVRQGPRNWELGFDAAPNQWAGDLMEQSDEDVEAAAPNQWPGDLMEQSDEDVEVSDDGNGIDMRGVDGIDMRVADSEEDVDISEGSDGIANRIENAEDDSEDFSD